MGGDFQMIRVGQRLPHVELGQIVGDELEVVRLEPLLEGRRVILVGLPGAFTPLCTGQHLPDLIAHADRLKAAGVHQIFCIAPNSPWVVREWADHADPEGKLTFLSDGNLAFTRAAGMLARAPEFFLGQCSKRYTMILQHAVVEKLVVEPQIGVFNCTRPVFLD